MNNNPNTTGLKPGENVTHGFYADGFIPCRKCPVKESCPNKDKLQDHRKTFRCVEEHDFYEATLKEIQEQFQLDQKDMFQLPQMIMTMIKLKRMNRYQAEAGPTGKTLLFNPKSGKEHEMDTPNVLNRDIYYQHKALMAWFDSLKLSRNARDAKQGLDVFLHMMKNGKKTNVSK